jgi:electron transfer flavoprotein beta subunit
MGPPQAEKGLKECISLGADEAVLVTDRAFAGADTLATSYVLGAAIRKIEAAWGLVHMVFCGKQTLDGDTGQVGPGVACRLDMDQLTYVCKVDQVDEEAGRVRVHRQMEDGVEVAETSMPVLFTVLKELNRIRRATLPGMVRAARYKPVMWTMADFPEMDRTKIGLKGSPTIVGRTWVPELKKANTVHIGGATPEAQAEEVAGKLWEGELPRRLGWIS